MNRILSVALILFGIFCFSATGWTDQKTTDNPKVRFETSHGVILLELNAKAAPKTVENFLAYIKEGHYAKTIFHRVIKGFMLQGGGFTVDMQQKSVKAAIKNEADNGLLNQRGTVAMARTQDPDSATAQFFINTVNNGFLDFKAKNLRGWGYCVFGKVIDGMDVVETIEKQPTTVKNGYKDVPVTPVLIKNASIITP